MRLTQRGRHEGRSVGVVQARPEQMIADAA